MKTAIYVRTDPKKHTPKLLANQIEDAIIDVRNYQRKLGTIYSDEATDGNKYAFRDGLKKMLSDAKKGKFNAVVTACPSALGTDENEMPKL